MTFSVVASRKHQTELSVCKYAVNFSGGILWERSAYNI